MIKLDYEGESMQSWAHQTDGVKDMTLFAVDFHLLQISSEGMNLHFNITLEKKIYRICT
jgi:hypothetical protein